MNRIRTLILEDEQHWQLILQRMVESHPLLELAGIFCSPLEALPAIAGNRPDLLLLDVEFAEINGFAFAQSLDNPPLIVFVTTHANFAAQSYEVEAVDFLVKPVQIDRFIKSIDKVRRLLELQNAAQIEHTIEEDKSSDFFFIKDQNGYIKLKPEEILFVKSMENYVQFITANNTYTTLASLQSVETSLGASFMRVHRSYLINLSKIDQFTNDAITIDNHSIPLGGQYADQFKNEFIYRNLLKR